MIDFSVSMIQKSLESCYTLRETIHKWHRKNRDDVDSTLERLAVALAHAEADLKTAQEEYEYAVAVQSRNASRKESFQKEVSETEQRISSLKNAVENNQRAIATLETDKRCLTQPVRHGETEEERAAYNTARAEYQRNTAQLNADINANNQSIRENKIKIQQLEPRVMFLKNKILQIEKANDQLEQIKRGITMSVNRLNEYIAKCHSAENSLRKAFDYFNSEVKKTRYHLTEYIIPKIELARSNGYRIQSDLNSILQTVISHSLIHDHMAIRFETEDDVDALRNDWHQMCCELRENAPSLLDHTNQYKRSIKSHVSSDVVDIVNKIDTELERIYWIINNQLQLLDKLAFDLKQYKDLAYNLS